MREINFKVALFDLDGVVFDTESQYTIFWGGQCRKYHPEIPGLEHTIKGQTLVQIFDKYFADVKSEQPLIVKQLHDFERNMDYRYIAGLTDYITHIKSLGVKTAIVTSSNKDKMEAVSKVHPELKDYFDDSVSDLALQNAMTKDDCYARLKKMYDGYYFDRSMTVGVYNPFSILNTFYSKDFGEYWFETGTPTLLVNVMKKTLFDVPTLSDNVVVSADDLSGMQDIINNPIPLFYQTGYLTIKGYDKEFKEYTLGFPNDEVKTGFLKFIYSYYVPANPSEGKTMTSKMARALRGGDPYSFMRSLEALFANTTYQIQGDAEKNFQYAMYIIMELLGEYVQAERSTSNGRIDLLLQTKDYIYIVELKIDNSAEAALQQIEDKGYAKPFVDDPRKLFKIGVSFSTANRRIEDWKVSE